MAASAIPLFLEIEKCPKFTMVHYPKELFVEINKRKNEINEEEYLVIVRQLYDWFTENLTSTQMVDYILTVSRNQAANKVLFIDKALTKKPDCQSAMILGGLKNWFVENCEVAFPLDCMYQDKDFPTKPHWWKTNFNIYRILNKSHRSENEKAPNLKRIINNIKTKSYDIIIYGSCTRSLELFKLATNYYPPHQIICINGEDDLMGGNPNLPPLSKRLKQRLRNLSKRNKYSGPQMDPSLTCISQWRKLYSEIKTKSTVFMRELVG
jgi:hypothetical protein